MGQPAHDTTTAESETPNAPSPTDAATEELTGAAAMFANDRASQHLGITVDDHGPGWAQC